MVVIAIIAILAAIAVPAYSNYVLKTRLQDEINKMDNYKKAIAIFIQETGVKSDTEFQSEIANVKDNYLGDENVAIMSELKNNNGRLLAHPVISGTTFQIAVTPRINENGSLVTWECNIRNETDNTTPPSSAMPEGCTSTNQDLNDDQEAYNEQYEEIGNIKSAALAAALSDYTSLRATLLNENEEYQGYLDDINTYSTDLSNFSNQVSSLTEDLGLKNNEIQTAQNNYDNAVANAATARENAANNQEPGSEYWNNLASDYDSDAAGYQTQLNTLNSEKDTIESNLSTANTNKDTANENLTTAITNRDNAYDAIDDTAKADSDYVEKVNTANTNYTNSLNEMNSSDAFSGSHVEQRDS
jgi:Tfp pilus assembly protein PilE